MTSMSINIILCRNCRREMFEVPNPPDATRGRQVRAARARAQELESITVLRESNPQSASVTAPTLFSPRSDMK